LNYFRLLNNSDKKYNNLYYSNEGICGNNYYQQFSSNIFCKAQVKITYIQFSMMTTILNKEDTFEDLDLNDFQKLLKRFSIITDEKSSMY
jgi:hypothetical protein